MLIAYIKGTFAFMSGTKLRKLLASFSRHLLRSLILFQLCTLNSQCALNVSVWACFTNHYYIVLCNVHCHEKLVYASLPLTTDLFASSPTNRFLSSLKQPGKPMVSLISMYLIKMCVLV